MSLKFSKRSAANLAECCEELQEVFEEVLRSGLDCSVLVGARDEATQNEMQRTGRSKLAWPNSMHNISPQSLAVDVAPYPIDWDDKERFIYFGGQVVGIAAAMGIKLRWGGAWNGERNKPGQFDDLVHFEMKEGRQ